MEENRINPLKACYFELTFKGKLWYYVGEEELLYFGMDENMRLDKYLKVSRLIKEEL